jgi:hypothetical protein
MNTTIRTTLVIATAAAALSLGGCKKKDSVEANNASVQSVADKVAASGIKPKAGQWVSTVKIDKMDIAGMPPQAKAMMQQRIGQARTATSCLTPEQANKPDASFFQQASKDCSYDHFSMTDGKIDAKMTCKHGAASQTMLMSGTYSEESYNIAINTQGEAQPGMPMTMAMSVASKRTGECTGKEGSQP